MTRFLREARARGFLRYIATIHDLVVAAAAFYLAYVTALGPDRVWFVPGMVDKILGFVAICAVTFVGLGLHRASWRYVSIPDVVTIVKVSAIAVVAYTIVAFLLSRGENVPRSVPVLTFIYLVIGLAAPRLSYRIFIERSFNMAFAATHRTKNKKHVLLCGMTDKAESFIRSVRRGGKLNVAGVVDDNPENGARLIQGVKVLGDTTSLARLVSKLEENGINISELVVTEINPGPRRLAHIVECATAVGLKVSRLPELTTTALITSQSLLEPKPIELGDLLERPEAAADVEGVAHLIDSKVVLATGAGGSIGSEISRQIATFNPSRLIITDSSEFQLYTLDLELRGRHPDLEIVTSIMDVRDSARVAQVFADWKPQVVFHAAALKHVPLVEANPLEGIKTNVLGTRNVADAALANGAQTFVMISTDKAVNPTNVMGATKRAAEAYCQALDIVSDTTRFKTVRFGNVLGSNGSVVPRFQEQIAAGGPVTVTHPHIVRYFMTIPEAVRLVLHASAQALSRHAERGKIMVLDMGKPVRITDLAERMIQLAGFKPRIDIDIVFTGLRPGEKLYEELFDPSEVQDARTELGFVLASPRTMDRNLLNRMLTSLETCLAKEEAMRAVDLLAHIVPEFQRSPSQNMDKAWTELPKSPMLPISDEGPRAS